MLANRMTQYFAEAASQASAPAVSIPAGFALVPVCFVAVSPFPQAIQQPQAPVQDIYRQAFEQAQADARWSRFQRRMFSVWN